jgi:hypothetical protein
MLFPSWCTIKELLHLDIFGAEAKNPQQIQVRKPYQFTLAFRMNPAETQAAPPNQLSLTLSATVC